MGQKVGAGSLRVLNGLVGFRTVEATSPQCCSSNGCEAPHLQVVAVEWLAGAAIISGWRSWRSCRPRDPQPPPTKLNQTDPNLTPNQAPTGSQPARTNPNQPTHARLSQPTAANRHQPTTHRVAQREAPHDGGAPRQPVDLVQQRAVGAGDVALQVVGL